MIDLTKIKLWSKRVLYAIVLILALLFVLTKCGGCDNKIEVVKTDNTALFAKIKSDSLELLKLNDKLVTSEAKTDSLMNAKGKAATSYSNSSKGVRDDIKKGKCDTVKVNIALNDCDSLNKVNDRIISQKDSTETTLKEANKLLTEDNATLKIVVKNLSGDYKALEKTSKKALRKQKFKTVVAIIGGVIVEVLTIFALK